MKETKGGLHASSEATKGRHHTELQLNTLIQVHHKTYQKDKQYGF